MNELLASLIISLQALVALLSMQSTVVQSQVQQTIIQSEVQSSTELLSFTAINNLYADTVVNILCKGSGKFKSGTATGVIVSPTGKILTNAHIAQYMLLEQLTDATISCTVRTGSPARDAYKAKVLYIPESWVYKNADQINKTEQKSTGQDDYAILQISKRLDSLPLSYQFNYLQTNANLLSVEQGQEVLIRAYPSEFLGPRATLHSLNPVSTVTTIKKVATFSDPNGVSTPTNDLVSLGGTIVAQGGSSGGAVIDSSGKLVGIIVTSTRKAETKDRNLKAITLSHINNSINEHTNKSLDELLSMTLSQSLAEFQDNLIDSARIFTEVYNR